MVTFMNMTCDSLKRTSSPRPTCDPLKRTWSPRPTRDSLKRTSSPRPTRDSLKRTSSPRPTRDTLKRTLSPRRTRDILKRTLSHRPSKPLPSGERPHRRTSTRNGTSSRYLLIGVTVFCMVNSAFAASTNGICVEILVGGTRRLYRIPPGWNYSSTNGFRNYKADGEVADDDGYPPNSVRIDQFIDEGRLPPKIRSYGTNKYLKLYGKSWRIEDKYDGMSVGDLWRTLPLEDLTADEWIITGTNARTTDAYRELQTKCRWKDVGDHYLHSDGKNVRNFPSTYLEYANMPRTEDTDVLKIDLTQDADYYVVIRDLLDTCPYPLPMFPNADGFYEIKCGGEITFGRHRRCINADEAPAFRMRIYEAPRTESLDSDVGFYYYERSRDEDRAGREMTNNVIFIPDRTTCPLGIFPSDFDAKPGFKSRRKYKMASVKLEQSFDKWQYIVIHKNTLSEFRTTYQNNFEYYIMLVRDYNEFTKADVQTDMNPMNATPAWKVVAGTRSYHKEQCNKSLTKKEEKRDNFTYEDENPVPKKKKGWFG